MSGSDAEGRAARLATSYLGMPLRSPVVASAGPRTRTVDDLRALADAGVGAIVLPSLFEEEVVAEEEALNEAYERGADLAAEFTDMLPELEFPDLGPDRHVRLVAEAKQAVDVPVIASVNATQPGS